MGNSCRIRRYDNGKLYDFRQVINQFKNYYGLDIEEIEKLFTDYSILEWDQIVMTLIKYNFSLQDIKEKKLSYEFYKKSLLNLSSKGIQLIDIIRYLNEFVKDDEKTLKYGEKLNEIGIFYFACALTGEGINKILVVLLNILKEFKECLIGINSINTYAENVGIVDEFAFNYGGNRIYPNESLIVYDTEVGVDDLDKTSFVINSYERVRRKTQN